MQTGDKSEDRVSQYVPDTAKQNRQSDATGNSACMSQRGADIIDELLLISCLQSQMLLKTSPTAMGVRYVGE